MMFICRFKPKEKKNTKKIELQHKNIKEKKRKIDIEHQNFIFIEQIRFSSSNTLLIFIFTV
jgi:hypothetical protein